ncbi:GNAT family N-acetyltransferase [Halococcus hamelinensis]|uniref:N-acetyltransferase domain-containing protein n=1 Tax=Halococcus hamelinensis 100A6 TaxID=1132509 RepID=M0LTH5_9EURY|nr:GNAT family N-acetyltransferase [Halococcus hamelinensis]EMA36448.1 hypothetical protein C447_14351 [Halococcus hamelinensis 100A6]
MSDAYRVRPYEPTDEDSVRALYETVSGHRPDPEWFEWKFARTPYSEAVPMFVAEHRTEIVGVRPYQVVPLSAGETALRAGYFQNMMLHPAHRGEGLFSRLNRRTIDHLDGRVSLLFCLTNENSRPIYAHWGWHEVTTARMYYRVQNPAAPLSVFRDDRVTRALGRLGGGLARGYLAACDQLVRRASDVRIQHESGVPAATVASLYRRHVPDALHVSGDEPYYEWRYDSPRWSTATHLATRDGDPIGAVVTRTRTAFGTRITHIADVLPMTDIEEPALGALLARTLDRQANSDVVVATETSLPRTLLLKSGFVPDDLPLLRRFRTGYVLFVTALDDTAVAFENADDWALPLAVRDTS